MGLPQAPQAPLYPVQSHVVVHILYRGSVLVEIVESRDVYDETSWLELLPKLHSFRHHSGLVSRFREVTFRSLQPHREDKQRENSTAGRERILVRAVHPPTRNSSGDAASLDHHARKRRDQDRGNFMAVLLFSHYGCPAF